MTCCVRRSPVALLLELVQSMLLFLLILLRLCWQIVQVARPGLLRTLASREGDGTAMQLLRGLAISAMALAVVFVFSLAPRGRMSVCCFHCGWYEVPSPFVPAQVIVVVALVLGAWRWCRVRPTPRLLLRGLAVCAASFSLLFSALSALQPIREILILQLVASIALLACVLIELRLHVPALPVAIVKGGS